METNLNDSAYLRQAILLADEAEARGNLPIGAVIALDANAIRCTLGSWSTSAAEAHVLQPMAPAPSLSLERTPTARIVTGSCEGRLCKS